MLLRGRAAGRGFVSRPTSSCCTSGALLRRKFSEESLRRCGLFFVRDDAPLTLHALRPRFRGRLMIPIRDHQGRVVAFTARQLELTPQDDPAREAKYVNSPETPIFTKGRVMFGLDKSKRALLDNGFAIICEGQLDLIACFMAGVISDTPTRNPAPPVPQPAWFRMLRVPGSPNCTRLCVTRWMRWPR